MAPAEVAPTDVAFTKAADMASAKPSAMTSPHATASEVASAASSPTTLAKRHRATRHRESADGDARQQHDDSAA